MKNTFTTNTCCTTKTYKMLAAVICLTAVFVFTNNVAFAQSAGVQSNTQTQKSSAIQIVDEETHSIEITQPSILPYINYKGITNTDEAKEAWVKDHPVEYKALTTTVNKTANEVTEAFINYKGIQDPAQAKIEWMKDNSPAAK